MGDDAVQRYFVALVAYRATRMRETIAELEEYVSARGGELSFEQMDGVLDALKDAGDALARLSPTAARRR
jgi:hypothetical protein